MYVITPKVYGDERGYFMETYEAREFQAAGIEVSFVQSNQSKSRKGVLRGLHFQKATLKGLVQVVKGEVFDVAVDLGQDLLPMGDGMGLFYQRIIRRYFIPEVLPMDI